MGTTMSPRLMPERSEHHGAVGDAPAGCRMCGAQKSCLPSLFGAADVDFCDGIFLGRRRVDRDASLYYERDPLATLFTVRFGEFKLTRRNSAGGVHVAQFCMAGELIGLHAIASGRHGFRMTALQDSEVCEISFSAITKLMAAHPSLLRGFLQSMSTALVNQAEHSSILSRPFLEERFASFLLEQGAKYEQLGYSGRSFRLGMTRADIGSYLGTTVESVSRLVSKFNAQRAVSINGRTVEIYDRAYLYTLISNGALECDRSCRRGH